MRKTLEFLWFHVTLKGVFGDYVFCNLKETKEYTQICWKKKSIKKVISATRAEKSVAHINFTKAFSTFKVHDRKTIQLFSGTPEWNNHIKSTDETEQASVCV